MERRSENPAFSATREACRILQESTRYDLGERRHTLRRDRGDLDRRVRELVTTVVASGDLVMFSAVNGAEVVRAARQALHFNSEVPQDEEEDCEDQARAEGLVYVAAAATAGGGGREGAERASFAAVQALEINIMTAADCISIGMFLRDLGWPELCRVSC